ncbi:FCD domain-containing protein [Rhodococcus wratislaviensis]|uniref:FCD domain-containing protein n=1 Tax=Rhodococcus wratislaviensis TaxID=44752 RepID=UPI003515C00F
MGAPLAVPCRCDEGDRAADRGGERSLIPPCQGILFFKESRLRIDSIGAALLSGAATGSLNSPSTQAAEVCRRSRPLIGGNSALVLMMATILAVSRGRMLALRSPAEIGRAHDGYTAILGCVVRGDGDSAAEAMRRHREHVEMMLDPSDLAHEHDGQEPR